MDIQMKMDEYKRKASNQKVTVFMLTHNRENYVKLAIESVLSQTYKDFTLVVLDNESEDNTKNVVESFDDNRLVYVYRKSVDGFINIQFAFSECVTDYLIVLHDDDIVVPTYLETMLNDIETNKYDAVSCDVNYIDENGNYIETEMLPRDDVIFRKDDYLKNFFVFNSNKMVYPATIYRKKFYENYSDFIGIMDAGPANDQMVWFQTERFGGTLHIVPMKLMNYRIHLSQDSSQNVGFMELELLDYLLKDDYYRVKLDNNISGVVDKIWRAFKDISKRYSKGFISKEKYKSFFEYDCVNYISSFKEGKIKKIVMMVIYKFSFVLKYYLKQK